MSNRINLEKFVDVWLEACKLGENQTWIAEQLNMSRQGISQRAGYLRARGVELPQLNLSSYHLNERSVDRLNERIRQFEVTDLVATDDVPATNLSNPPITLTKGGNNE